jgi:hypothetical protein
VTQYLIACRQCPRPAAVTQAFDTEDERAKWERVHNHATGHNLYELEEAETP